MANIIKKKVEDAFYEKFDIINDGDLSVSTTLADLCERIHEAFSEEEVAYFMFMLTDDGGELTTEQEYLKIFAKHYGDLGKDDNDYKSLAKLYKELLNEY